MKSFAEVQHLFVREYPTRLCPEKSTIWYNVRKYEEHGTSLNLNSKLDYLPLLISNSLVFVLQLDSEIPQWYSIIKTLHNSTSYFSEVQSAKYFKSKNPKYYEFLKILQIVEKVDMKVTYIPKPDILDVS